MKKMIPRILINAGKKGSFLLFVLAMLAPAGVQAQYCNNTGPASGQFCCGPGSAMGVINFQMGSINNSSPPRTSGSNTPGPNEDYTYLSTTVTPGQTVNFTITTQGYVQWVRIWVDLNNDNSFDNTTEVMYSNQFTQPGTNAGSFVMPCASAGAKRMRVFADYENQWTNLGYPPSPCGNIYYGTAHDYTLNVNALTGLDIEMTQKNSPSQFSVGDNNLSVKIRNAGGTTITSATVGYQLDNNTPVTQNLSGLSLASCQSMDHAFSTPLNLSGGNYTLKIWATRPNNTYPDAKTANDTLTMNICTGMSGSYTINASGSGSNNYTSFNAAVNALLNCGIIGPVTFNVAAGTYNEQIIIPALPGASATNTVTFEGTNSATRTLTYNTTDQANSHILRFEGAQYVQFRNLTIQTTGANYGWPVLIKSNTAFIKLKKNIIQCLGGAGSNTGTGFIPIVLSNSNTSYSSSVSTHDIEIDSNVITNGYFGAVMWGNGTSNTYEIKVRNNVINNQYYYGVYFVNTQGSVHVINNKISLRSTTNTGGYGIALQSSNPTGSYYTEVSGNEIFNSNQYGIQLNSMNNSSTRGRLFNNIIRGEFKNPTSYGIYLSSCTNWDIWHNTVDMNYPATSNTTGCLYLAYGSGQDIKNNIFSISNPSSASVGVYINTATEVSSMDYNNFYKNSGTASTPIINIGSPANLITVANLKGGGGFNHNSISEEPPFVSATNLRLSSAKLSPFGDPGTGVNKDIDGKTRCAAYPSLGASESPYVVPLLVGMTVPDTLFVNSPFQVFNTATEGEPKTHIWDIANGMATFNTVHFTYTFPDTGLYKIRLQTTGCSGMDTAVKMVRVINPVVPPISAFISNLNNADQGYPVKFSDISTGGASSWEWTVNPTAGVQILPSAAAQNPNIIFGNIGTYEVCLTASNSAGAGNKVCKSQYINVIETNNFCGSAMKSKTSTGKIFDSGGKNGDYGSSQNCSFLIDPCASNVSLVFSSFDLANGDYLRVYDGKDNTGTPLHTGSGFTGGIIPGDLAASTGKMYLEFVSNGSGNAAGFEAKWTSVAAQFNKPMAAFKAPDTLYTGTIFTFTSNSTGIEPELNWDFDNDGNFDASGATGTHTFTTAGTYVVRLAIEDCGGVDGAAKSITIIDPTTAPTPDFVSDFTTISVNQNVKFYDRSSQAPSSWEWVITPSTFTFENGTSETSQNPEIKFTATGNYNITLKADNAFGQGSTTKTAFIKVVEYCFPGAGLHTDIGITRVTFAGIDNVSLVGPATYSNYTQTVQSAAVQKGAKYPITLQRALNSEDMSRKVWIDYNGNGTFESSELVASHTADNSLVWTDSITIPTTVSEGSTRMRIGTGYGATNNSPCGINPYGEFEDYTVTIYNNLIRPVITVIGSPVINLEVGSSYTDSGATAVDDIEGVITHRILTTNNVDLNTVGTYYYRYNVADLEGNSSEATREINVTPDVTAPVLTLLGSNPMDVVYGDMFTDPGATAFDTYDGNITANIQVSGGPVNVLKLGQYVLNYEVSDAAGNMTTDSRIINVIDTAAPELILKGADTIYLSLGATYTEPGAIVMDNFNKGLPYQVSGDIVNNEVVGTYVVIYSATDSSGNSAVPQQRVVMVQDITAPTLTLIGDTVTVKVFSTYEEPGYIALDNYYQNVTVNISGSVNTSVVGTYVLLYTAEDGSGNISDIKVRLIRVVDVEAPVITLNGDKFMNLCRWDEYVEPGVTVTDNYDNGLKAIAIGTVDGAAEGIYSITYTVTDKSGNQSNNVERLVRVLACATGFEDGEKISAKLYPNPSAGLVNIEFSSGDLSGLEIKVKDMLGREVKAKIETNSAEGKATVDLGENTAGIYFISMIIGNEISTQKIEIIK